MNQEQLSDYELEMFILGELPSRRMKQIKEQLKTDNQLKEEVDKIKKSNDEILNEYPGNNVIPKIFNRYDHHQRICHREKTIKPRQLFFRRFLYASPVLALAIVLLLFLFHVHEKDRILLTNDNLNDDIRIKGIDTFNLAETNLIIHRKQDNQVELLRNGVQGKAGDILQLAYVAAEQSYGIILSIDGSGKVTLHFPEQIGLSTAIEKNKKILLPNAIELDNAPDFERFFFITSERNIDIAEIIKKAEILGNNPTRAKTDPLDLPESYQQFSRIILKEVNKK